jgi:hypothetical protein
MKVRGASSNDIGIDTTDAAAGLSDCVEKNAALMHARSLQKRTLAHTTNMKHLRILMLVIVHW